MVSAITFATVSSPFFSVIMPSYLGDYGGNYGQPASNREAKILRAIGSCLAQTFTDWELIIVADGCDKTWELQHHELLQDARIKVLRIDKQRLWSGVPRNTGIFFAKGTYIAYLDTDDAFAPDHLQGLFDELLNREEPELAIVDDWVWSAGQWVKRIASATKENSIGTSNIIHARRLGSYWPEVVYRWPAMGYDHDLQFYRVLQTLAKPVKLEAGGYLVHHIPRQYDL